MNTSLFQSPPLWCVRVVEMAQNPVTQIIASAAKPPASAPMNAAESFFDSIGLMRGDYAPVGRVAVGFGVGAAVMFAVLPGFAFNADGSAKQWGKGANGTSLPWFAIPAAVGLFCGLFI